MTFGVIRWVILTILEGKRGLNLGDRMVDFLGWKLGFLIKILEFLMRFREFLMGVEMEECRQTLTKESGFFVVN